MQKENYDDDILWIDFALPQVDEQVIIVKYKHLCNVHNNQAIVDDMNVMWILSRTMCLKATNMQGS